MRLHSTFSPLAEELLLYQFAATACTIVSGAIAERTKFEAYILYSFFMASWVYPILTHSVWSTAGWAGMFRSVSACSAFRCKAACIMPTVKHFRLLQHLRCKPLCRNLCFQLMPLCAFLLPKSLCLEQWSFVEETQWGTLRSGGHRPALKSYKCRSAPIATPGRGFLISTGAIDYAGSGAVHMVGGYAAAAGCWIVGPRIGRFLPDGTVSPCPHPSHSPSSMSAVTSTLVLCSSAGCYKWTSCSQIVSPILGFMVQVTPDTLCDRP